MSEEWTNPVGGDLLRPQAADDGSRVLSLAAGLVAALVGGAIWAAVGIYGNLEVGWVAWGIGLLVGGAMAVTTRRRSRALAVTAAMLALLGLLAGKAMTFAGSAGTIAEELVADEDYMRGMTAWDMYTDGTLDPELRIAVEETEARGDTLSDALWADMLAAADDRLTEMTETERLAMARGVAAGAVRELGLIEGVRMQLTAFDLLWLFLALATAFRMMDSPKPEPAGAEEAVREPQGVA